MVVFGLCNVISKKKAKIVLVDLEMVNAMLAVNLDHKEEEFNEALAKKLAYGQLLDESMSYRDKLREERDKLRKHFDF